MGHSLCKGKTNTWDGKIGGLTLRNSNSIASCEGDQHGQKEKVYYHKKGWWQFGKLKQKDVKCILISRK